LNGLTECFLYFYNDCILFGVHIKF
jgi:hypothetical protein